MSDSTTALQEDRKSGCIERQTEMPNCGCNLMADLVTIIRPWAQRVMHSEPLREQSVHCPNKISAEQNHVFRLTSTSLEVQERRPQTQKEYAVRHEQHVRS